MLRCNSFLSLHLKNVCFQVCNLKIHNLNVIPSKRIYTSASVTTKEGFGNQQWRIIYQLPLIRLASAFNRLKMYQGLITSVSWPGSYLMEHSSLIPENSSLVVAAVGVSGLLTLAISSFAIKNLIGIIYINENNEQLKLAYVDYWGKRQQTFLNINDLILTSGEIKPLRFGGFQIITCNNNKKVSYKLLQRYGQVIEADIYGEIFDR